MAAPTVTRPRATLAPETASTQASKVDWATYSRYLLMVALVVGLVGMATAWFLKISEDSREARVRAQWDEVYKGMKDKKSASERIAALETLAENEKIKGTTAHASVLMELAQEHVDMAQNAKRGLDERKKSRDSAALIYKFVAETEPFKNNPAFGPLAVRGLAVVYEQAQADLPEKDTKLGLDMAINTLTDALFQGKGVDAPPVESMKAHYLFNPMQAQLGRLYWLRSQMKQGAEQEADLKLARNYINKAIEAPPPEEERQAMQGAARRGRLPQALAAWRETAAYIKSLLDAPGKMVKDGVPPMKEKPAEKKDDKQPAPPAPNTNATDKNTPAQPAKVETPAKPDAAKPDAKKEEPKKEEPKKNEPKKEEPKKTGSTESPDAPTLASYSDTPPPAAHLSYAQIQKLLKEGKSALCQCPRCVDGAKSIGAKLQE